ncbi:MAG: dienelactone hydrolase, partial [Pseudomonas sp.]
MYKIVVWWMLCWLGIVSVAQAEPAQHWSVGLHRLVFADPLDARPVQALAFYPSTAPARSSRIDGYRVNASEGAPIAIGRYPLLMLSHGNTGTPLALHDLATALARRGFVV